jgi:hypothetical protein
MRTTLDLDDDVLAAAKELARRQKLSAGAVVSKLLREALSNGSNTQKTSTINKTAKNGFVPFPSRGVVVSDALIDQLRDLEGI